MTAPFLCSAGSSLGPTAVSCSLFRLRAAKKKYERATNASAATTTPTLIPPFAPLLRPEDVAAGGTLDAADAGDVFAGVTVDVLIVLETSGGVVLILYESEEDVEEEADAALSTRKPGLERSPSLGLKIGDVTLNLRTYLALTVRFPSGMTMVQAKLPGDVRLISAVFFSHVSRYSSKQLEGKISDMTETYHLSVD